MPTDSFIHQLLHGYRKGHTLLAASIDLPTKSSELIKRLSDLSGLSIEDDFSPYLTAYPIPDIKFYAISKTWADLNASRKGCVLTHTLLIPKDCWKKIKFPKALNNLFSRPEGNFNFYQSPISYNESSQFISNQSLPHIKDDESFIYKYFYQGLKPIVWWDEPLCDEIFWKLLEKAWAKLRQNFACCTYNLQPRNIDDRPFDVMFAPSDVYARFNKISRDNFVNWRNNQKYKEELENLNYSVSNLTSEFFYQGSNDLLKNTIEQFADILSEEPTSIRNIIRLEELKKRVDDSPTATIGLMDVVGALAPSELDAVDYKKRIVKEALETAKKIQETNESLKFLYLISERLEKSYFILIKQDFSKQIIKLVSLFTQKDPYSAIFVGERLFSNFESKNKSSYFKGVIKGLAYLAKEDSQELIVLNEFPIAATLAISENPRIAKGYLRSINNSDESGFVSSKLSSWISPILEAKQIGELRKMLIPELNDDHIILAEQLLKNIDKDDLLGVLNSVSKIDNISGKKKLRQIISSDVTNIFPLEVQSWANKLENWNSSCSIILADSFEKSVSGLEELLLFPFSNNIRKCEVLTYYLLDLASNGFSYWFREFSKNRVDFLIPLIITDGTIPNETLDLLNIIFTEIDELSIAKEPIILEHLPNLLDYNWSNLFVASTMSSLIKDFLTGEAEWNTYHSYLKTDWALNWLLSSNLGAIENLLRTNCNFYYSWKRCWAFLATLPDSFFLTYPFVFQSWINILIYERHYSWDWTETEVDHWCQIIKNVSNENEHFQLCSFALDFSFKNRESPFSKLVVETFWTIYKIVLVTDSDDFFSGSLYNILSWLNWDWDKAKSLRKKLVQSFLSSSWMPGDIAIAIPDDETLRKIIKRILDEWNGHEYVNAILFDLGGRKGKESKSRYKFISNLLKNNEINESWY